MRKIWAWFIGVVVLSFIALIWVGTEVYQTQPPIPDLVTIKNILGQEVYRHKPESLPEIEIDISKLSDGTYIVKAVSDNKLHNFKIIKESE